MNEPREKVVDGRLLILDDDEMIGQTICRIAELDGVAARFTSTPDQFFQLVADWKPTHVAVDLVMPEMDGVQVLNRLAEAQVKARIIITSGVGQRVLEAAGRTAREHGLDIAGVLPKPFSAKALRELIRPADVGSGRPGPAAPDAKLESEATVEQLRRAIKDGELEPAYQAKVHCSSGGLAGFEALARWRHPERGVIGPDRFIALAEGHGLIDGITEQIVGKALKWFSSIQTVDRLEGLTMSLNLSPRSLGNVPLIEGFGASCEQLGVHPSRVIFELTETSTMADPTASLELLTRLRVRGFHLSIDDFGTGFSSMLQLVRLPFSEIKVDRSFVSTAADSEESRSVIRSIVELGRSLGLKTVAEGIEDEYAMEFLRKIGCDYAQGYLIARPETGEEVIRRWGLAER